MAKTEANMQLKGTDICMDLHCKCGCSSHIDGMFTFYVECPECGEVYKVHSDVKLSEVKDETLDFEPIIGEL